MLVTKTTRLVLDLLVMLQIAVLLLVIGSQRTISRPRDSPLVEDET